MAETYRKEFRPQEGVEYRWVCEYAKVNYDMLHDAFNTLDEKADTIIKHLTGGTGLLALGAIGFIAQNSSNAWIALMAIPALAAALWAVRQAIQARKPSATSVPPPVRGAVQYAEEYGEHAEARFLGQWHQIICSWCVPVLARI
jgi:hypothetical protein